MAMSQASLDQLGKYYLIHPYWQAWMHNSIHWPEIQAWLVKNGHQASQACQPKATWVYQAGCKPPWTCDTETPTSLSPEPTPPPSAGPQKISRFLHLRKATPLLLSEEEAQLAMSQAPWGG